MLSRPQKLVLGWLAAAITAAGAVTWAGEAALSAFAVPMAPAALSVAADHTVAPNPQR